VTRNLRISLTILSIGFGIEGAGEVYSRLVAGASTPGSGILYLLPLVFTAIGLLFVWIGREEWNQLHIVRVRTAHRVFALTLLGAVVAALVVGLLLLVPSLGVPSWAAVLFGAAVASLVFGTFVTYAFLVLHLISNPGRAAVALALIWSGFISALVGITIAGSLSTILALARTHQFSVPAFVSPVEYLLSFLFVSYFLFLAAYVEAHRAVARGRVTIPDMSGGPPPPSPVTQRP